MTLDQFVSAWPVVLWATTMIFFVGGAWVTLYQLKSELKYIRPLIEKIPVIEAKLDKAEKDIEKLQNGNHSVQYVFPTGEQ